MTLDERANETATGDVDVSAAQASARVLVVTSREDLAIAANAMNTVDR